MPKPNFVKKPIDKLLDEPLSKLPDKKEKKIYCSYCNVHHEPPVCDADIDLDEDIGLDPTKDLPYF